MGHDDPSSAAASLPRAGDRTSAGSALEQTAEVDREDDGEPPALVVASFDAPAIVPAAEPDYASTAADFIVGTAARFEANLVAIATLKMLEGESRSPTQEERTVLARFSGFGDSAFEPAFRLNARRKDEQVWVERGHRLRDLVPEREWESLERSRLNAFFLRRPM